jgi:hypothetical protein
VAISGQGVLQLHFTGMLESSGSIFTCLTLTEFSESITAVFYGKLRMYT